MADKPRILSGMRPTGPLHVGHLEGALENYLRLQDECDCFFMVADWHALTTGWVDVSGMRQNVLGMVADWLAVGLDPAKAVIFRQSKVLQHAELSTLLGMLTASWLRTNRTLQRKCAGMLGAGLVLILLGQLWNPWFPINKKLWTSSFVLFMGGCSLVLWAFFMWLTEIKGWRKGTGFWLVFGMNAIASYAVSDLLAAPLWAIHVSHMELGYWIYLHVFDPIHPPGLASLLYSIAFVLACWAPMFVLYRKKIFLKV